MHLVSCRHSTSGRAALRNLATRSMRSRTELMFQVVREKRMGRTYQARAKNAPSEWDAKEIDKIRSLAAGSSCPGLSRASTSWQLLRRKDVDGRDKPGHDGKRTIEGRGQPGG